MTSSCKVCSLKSFYIVKGLFHIYAHTQTHTYIYIFKSCKYICVCVFRKINTYIYTYIKENKYIHTYIYLYTHTHTPDTLCDMPTKSKTFTFWPLMQSLQTPNHRTYRALTHNTLSTNFILLSELPKVLSQKTK